MSDHKLTLSETKTPSSTKDSESMTILASSASLKWDGINIERGYADLIVSNHVTLPQHCFGMLTSSALTWECKDNRTFTKITSQPGHICVYPANTPVARRVSSYYEFILLAIDPSTLMNAVYDVPLKTENEFKYRHNADDPQLRGIMYALLAEAESGNPNGRLFVDSLLTALSIHFVQQYSVEQESMPTYCSGLTRQQLRRVFEYIEAHLKECFSLESLARETGLSKSYFCRLFKRSTGLTPYRYVMLQRLKRAKALLMSGKYTILETAYEFGFSDQSHFSRFFKNEFGLPPGTFLKKNS